MYITVIIDEAGKALHNEDLENGGGEAVVRLMLRMTNKKKDTAMHEAARSNSVEVVNVILEKEVPGFSYFANDSGESPLYLAVYHGNTDVAKKILNTCQSVEYGSPNGKTALHPAVLCDDLGTHQLLINAFLRFKFESQ